MEIIVVRLGHRTGRDLRTTTHVALASRALGAKRIILCGDKEESILNTVRSITKKWGGKYGVQHSPKWKKTLKTLKNKGYCLVHSTMYGEPIQKIVPQIQKHPKIAVIVGAEKVPRDVYHLATYNVSVTSQPHSETAALAIILDRIQNGKELEQKFSKAKIKIIPCERGKQVKSRKKKKRSF